MVNTTYAFDPNGKSKMVCDRITYIVYYKNKCNTEGEK